MKDVTATNQFSEFLSKNLRAGDTINCILRHVSRSGMSREISLLKGEMDISWYVARYLGYKQGNQGGIKINGCGMDMGFALVYELSRKLFDGKFICIGEKCRANDHSNKPYPKRDGKMLHSDSGYALNMRWL